jgi:glycosyltransferase involved in cell wall biosynthesis
MGLIPNDIEAGVGGAELALLSLTKVLADMGNIITVYNNPKTSGVHEGVEFRDVRSFNPEDTRDAVVLFRTPYPKYKSCKGRHVFWSCDQFTTGSFDRDIFPFSDTIICISDRHAEYFLSRYQEIDVAKMEVVGLGVRAWEYEGVDVVKDPFHCIYCSMPDRGLEILQEVWPKIVERVPKAHLTITSDYRLWGSSTPRNENHRLAWTGVKNVEFLGRVPRSQLVKLQLSAGLQPYPCTYDELFCISTAECQVAGCVPITSETGALVTTNLYGKKISGSPKSSDWKRKFVEEVVTSMETPESTNVRRELCTTTKRTAFNWTILATVWEELLK